ncbi:MAG: FldZ protein, partial [Paenibacillus sp.]|nr:FldZ protein [Paenibacillus sp.]
MTTLSNEEKQKLMEVYRKLRVADVRDGMDWNMMHHIGSIYTDTIKPLFRTRFCGFAKTVRFVPTDKIIPTMEPDEYTKFSNHWYGNIATYQWGKNVQEDDVIVLDASDTNVGIIGSNNGLEYKSMGARGIITNGGARDTDELILNEVPVYCRHVAQTMVQGRVEFQAMDVPVNINGTLIRPNDIIVADGDGIVVVPVEKAWDVAKYAMQEMEAD